MDRKTFFNEMASGWDKRFYTDELKEHLKSIVSSFNLIKGSRLLDVGSGTGGLIPYLLDAAGPDGTIHAVDFAEEMIHAGKEKFKEQTKVVFHAASVESMPFVDEFFDYVICFGAFPHFEDKAVALREMKRVLKSQGSLLIAHALSSDEIKDHHRKAEPVKYDCLPDEPEMRLLIHKAGLSIIRIIDQKGMYLCEALKGKHPESFPDH
jgi:ubiquinone/menaquinone biosynthesis C-methylase UbiE